MVALPGYITGLETETHVYRNSTRDSTALSQPLSVNTASQGSLESEHLVTVRRQNLLTGSTETLLRTALPDTPQLHTDIRCYLPP